MSGFGKKSTAYICYLIVNFWWYLSCLLGGVFPLIMVYEYIKGTHPDSIFGISVPLKTSLVSLRDPVQSTFLSIDEVRGQVDFDYIMQNDPIMFILWATFLCIVIWLGIFGIYQLRNLLKSSVNSAVFTEQNIWRIKVMAFIILLVEPLGWVLNSFVYSRLDTLVPNEGIEISISLPFTDSGWTFLIVGLLIYTLAAVFEKGYEMYQEQKFTI